MELNATIKDIPVFPPKNTNIHPGEYNLYLGFLIPIGAILMLCIISLFVVSWQIICPTCSRNHCPKILLSGSNHIANMETPEPPSHSVIRYNNLNRRTSVTVLRRYSDTPPSYDTVDASLPHPPSYDSVVIVEEERPLVSNHGNHGRHGNKRASGRSSIRTYVYDPTKQVSIEVHDEDTIRVVEELLNRQNSVSTTRQTSMTRQNSQLSRQNSQLSRQNSRQTSSKRSSSKRNSINEPPPQYHAVRYQSREIPSNNRENTAIDTSRDQPSTSRS